MQKITNSLNFIEFVELSYRPNFFPLFFFPPLEQLFDDASNFLNFKITRFFFFFFSYDTMCNRYTRKIFNETNPTTVFYERVGADISERRGIRLEMGKRDPKGGGR